MKNGMILHSVGSWNSVDSSPFSEVKHLSSEQVYEIFLLVEHIYPQFKIPD